MRGIAAGLHVTVALPAGDDEEAIRREAARAPVEFGVMGDYGSEGDRHPPTLLLGYAAAARARDPRRHPPARRGRPRRAGR